MKIQKRYAATALLLMAASAGAQQRPPIRQLGATVGKSTEAFVNVTSVRPLSNGSVLVNDPAGRRLVLFNPQLSSFTLIADSTSATSNAYGGRTGGLAGYKGDSSIFVDPSSLSMLVIDPSGKIARVISVPRAQDAQMLASPIGNPVLAPNGKLVYRAQPGFQLGGNRTITLGGGANGAPAGIPGVPNIPDSAPVLRIDLATRVVDTIGYIRTPKIKMDMQHDDNGNVRMSSLINPLPTVDDWAMTPDGAVAFVRGSDYHVDWINPDGTRASSPKVPFEWQRMTDEDKVAFIDSVKAARARQAAAAPTVVIAGGANPAPAGGGGTPNIQIFAGPGAPGGGPGRGSLQTTQSFIPASELPDYKPPFFAGSTRADTEGNLWIRTIPTSAIAGGPVYDVINRKGELVDRVQIPAGRTILAFGPAGAVYMVNRDGATVTIERASIK
ncbi:MAG TPA: hypothetical protein VM053_01500 [Gemmatimonadaceae bacterium]|nr:hypothetical protein [Gemmatimonadaceae bacterium]